MMKDNFSQQSAGYAKYRPGYPQALIDFILEHVKNRETAWDCGTGNGQTAKLLAEHFKTVFATDISSRQLDHAHHAPNIKYSIQPAEQTDFPPGTFDLITVSQALHWFRFEEFYKEVKRVSRPEAWIAVWMYGLLRITPEIDKLMDVYHNETLGAYWDAERKYVNENYMTIPFPFREITTPEFTIEYDWTKDELEGYLNTWSVLREFIAANQYNPVPDLVEKIAPYWVNEKMRIVFPLYLRMGIVDRES
jgi:ubiquinone/menaquinone biosynthesis C-methylase UbiE